MSQAHWETLPDYQARHDREWPIVRRGDAIAIEENGKWWIWDGGDPVTFDESNSKAWFDFAECKR